MYEDRTRHHTCWICVKHVSLVVTPRRASHFVQSQEWTSHRARAAPKILQATSLSGSMSRLVIFVLDIRVCSCVCTQAPLSIYQHDSTDSVAAKVFFIDDRYI
jgi:hypothetical protein